MNKFAFLTATVCICGSVMADARSVSDINSTYSRDEIMTESEAATDRLGYIVNQITNTLYSFTLMKEVNDAVSATNNAADRAADAEWRRLNPDQDYFIDVTIMATNSQDGIIVYDEWLKHNTISDKMKFYWSTNNPSRRAFSKGAKVDVYTNYIFTAREKRDYNRLKKAYRKAAYDVIGNLSAEDYVTYTNQCEIADALKKDYKIIESSCRYMQNYTSITNKEATRAAEQNAKDEKARAAEIANSLTSDQEDRYYEIIDTMEDLGYMTSDNDINLLRALNNNGRVVGASKSRMAQSTATLIDRVNYIKSLSKEDQRIFKVGNKKLRIKAQLKSELTEEEWQIYRKIQEESKQYIIYSDKLKFVANLTDDEKVIYRSGRRIKLQQSIDAKKAFADPTFTKKQAEKNRFEQFKKQKGYVTEDSKTASRIRSSTKPIVHATK